MIILYELQYLCSQQSVIDRGNAIMLSSNLVSSPSESPTRHWAFRIFGGLVAGGSSSSKRRSWIARVGPNSNEDSDQASPEVQAATQGLIADERYAFVLLNEAADSLLDADTKLAWKAIEAKMALVPGGMVPVVRADGSIESTALAGFYLDRFAVTNRQFRRFVQAGCYDSLEIWPREIWPGLLRFTDRTGLPGPANWEHGTFRADLADHPVVGVCWCEALAYARWVGKRLPTAPEWQKASGWPEHLSGGTCNRYPWGDLYAESRANLWASGLGRTAPVGAFSEGATLNGIYQMSGNVWEWLDDSLEAIACRPDETFWAHKPLRRIIGGAFDTYLPGEAINHFVTGQPELDRRSNIGFRCALSVSRLRSKPQTGTH
jgi:gamma-glutamyl hercynylcysteine S-oxide synthase